MSRAVTMPAVYPHNVDPRNPTIGGLAFSLRSGITTRMRDQENQFFHIGERLRAIREGFSTMSQKEWAGKHNFGQTQYNNWERGNRRIPVDDAERLCSLYGVTLDFVYRGRRDGLSESASKVL